MKITKLSVILLLMLAICCMPPVAAAEAIDDTDEDVADEGSSLEVDDSKYAGMSATDLNNLGGMSLKGGDMSAAILAYQAAMMQYPDDPVAYYNMGYIFIDYLADTTNGIPLLEKAVELDPENTDSWFYLGTAYVLIEDKEKAYYAFQKALDVNPLNDAAWYFLGMMAETLGDIDEALECFEEALSINPDNPLVHQSKGVLFSVRGEHEKALESLSKADPESLVAQFYIGASNLELGNSDIALESFQKVSKMEPLDSLEEGFVTTSLYNIGVIQSAAGETSTAISTLQEAVERSDEQSKSWLQLGRAYLDEENYSEAISALNKAIGADPENGAAYFYLGNALADLGQSEAAFDAFTDSLTYDPDNSMAWENLGTILFQFENYLDAAPAFADAVRLDPDNANAWGYLARSLWYEGDEPGAVEAFGRALLLMEEQDLEPEASLLNDYGVALNDIKRYEEALAVFNEATSLESDVPDYWFNKGNVLNNLGESEEALASYQKAVSIDPSPLGYNNIGLVHMQLQEYEEALAAFESVLALNDKLSDVWTSKALALYHLERYEEALDAIASALAIEEFAPATELKAVIDEKLNPESEE
jgi:superkiller protein 3